jgi:hypothetical protein
VWFYLRAGRAWLAWSFVGLRTLSLLLDFLTGQNMNYLEKNNGFRNENWKSDAIGISAWKSAGSSIKSVNSP